MPSREDSTALALIEEAAVLAEAAERDFVALREEIRKTLETSSYLTAKTIVAEEQARLRLYNARMYLTARIKRRDPKSVTACYCRGRRWVCHEHPAIALEDCGCGAAAVPCACNPRREPPPGYMTSGGTWNSPRSIR